MIRILIIALTLVGCGGKVKPAEDQATGGLQLPDFEGKGKAPFALTDAQTDILYKGNLLFWDAKVSPEQVTRVSNASLGGRLARAERLKLYKEELYPAKTESKQREAEALQLDQAVIQSRTDNFDEIVALQRPLLVNWVPNRLDALKQQGLISEANVQTALTQLGVYCQAKLWETAANPLLGRKYASRPLPLATCEAYYEQAKLLDRSTEACADAPAGETKDYLDCFWKEGVVKTELFAARTTIKCKPSDPNSPTRTDAVQAWLGTGALQGALKAEFAAATGLVGSGAIASAVVSDKTIPVGVLTPECATAFKGKAGQAPGVGTMIKPLAQLLNIVEAGEGIAQAPFTYELLIPSDAATEKDIKDRYEYLARDLRTFAVRYNGPSVNDRIFNNDDAKSVRESDEIRFAYANAPDFAPIRQVEVDYVPAELSAKKAANKQRRSELATILKDLDAKEGESFKKLVDVTQEGASASMAEGVSVIFVGFNFRLTKVEDRIEVRLNIRDPNMRSAVGCVTVAGEPCEAVRTEAEADWGSLGKVGFNGDKNELVMELLLDDPAAQGLVFEATETKHNLLPVEDLNGRTLRFTAWSNQLHGLLDFFTGKVELVQNGSVEREGSMSGDAFDANLAVWK